MSGTKPQDRAYRRLNALGWFMLFPAVLLIVGMIVRPWFIEVLDSREPSVWRYGFQATLLMVDIPLAWAAWKAVRTERHYMLDRASIALWVLMCSMLVIGGGLDLQKGATWRPQTSLILAITLVLAVHAFGRKRRITYAPARDASSNDLQQAISVDAECSNLEADP